MTIAIIGSGNVGGTLAQAFLKAGHTVLVGARFPLSEKSLKLAQQIGEDRFTSIGLAVQQADVIVLAVPATEAAPIAAQLGDTVQKVIIDTMNIVMGRGPEGYTNTADAVCAHTASQDVVKCFNTTGFENMADPRGTDMFVAGDSARGKYIASQLARDIGFGMVWDMGGNDKFYLIEQLANVWINQAIFQKAGRNMTPRFTTH